MSNRHKSGAPVPIRQPLLAVLEAEYARALKVKNLDRAEQITEIVEAINRLFSEPVEPQPPVVRWEGRGAIEVWTPPQPAELPPVGGFQLQDLLKSVPEGLWGDPERREEAKGRVKDAVFRAAHATLGEQMRYELALQAHNRNNRALELFEPEAVALGLGVADLAARIITERRTAERRMMYAYAVLARVSAQIDQATGQNIDHLAEAAIHEIQSIEE